MFLNRQVSVARISGLVLRSRDAMNVKRILTIQDVSCVGQCSTTVALPLISACGVECAVLPPAILSNHTAPCFSSWTFCDLTAEMPKIEAKWVELGVKFDAFYTGYVCESHIDHILSIMKTCGRPGAMRFVDPAMADDGELYRGFAGDFPAKIARLCSGADYILPNMTEAALLVGERPVLSGHSREYVESLVSRLHALGAKNVVLTGVSFERDMLGTAVSNGDKIEYDFNPRLARTSHGTGDIFASVFSAAVLRGKAAAEAAVLAADVVCSAIESTEPDHLYGVSFETVIPALVKAF